MTKNSKQEAIKLCEKAQAILKKAASLNLSKPDVVLKAGDLFMRAGELDETIAEPYFGLAMIVYAGGESNKALALLEKASQIEPHSQKVEKFKRQIEQDMDKEQQGQVEHTQKVSFMVQLNQLKSDVKNPKQLFQLVQEVFRFKLSREESEYLFSMLNASHDNPQDNKKILKILTSISPLLGKKPLQFVIKLKSKLKDIELVKGVSELNEVILTPQHLFKQLNQVFSYKISKSRAFIFYQMIQNGTIDGEQTATMTDWMKIIKLIQEIVPGQSSFHEKYSIFIKEIVVSAI